MSTTNTLRFILAMGVVLLCAPIGPAAEEGQRKTTPAPTNVHVQADGGNREKLSAKPPASLRVITFNTQFLPGVAARFNKRGEPSYRAKAIGRAMATFDIVGLNEVFDPVHRKELFDELRGAWGDRFHAVTAPCEQCSPLGVDSGLAILTQLPVVESHSTPFGNGSGILQYGVHADGLAAKGVLHARIEIRKNRCVDVFVTHLESADRQIREKQYQLLGETIARYADPAFPVLVMGDLNTSGAKEERANPTSSYSKLLASLNRSRPRAPFLDVWPQLHVDSGGTNAPDTADGGTRIDYILTSASRGVTAALTPIRVEIEPFTDPKTKTLSDHAAVKAVLEYDGSAKAHIAAKGDVVITTDDTEVRVEAADDFLRLVSLKCRQSDWNWAADATHNSPVPLIASIEIGGHSQPLHWRYVGTEDGGSSRRVFRFANEHPSLQLESIWLGHSGPGPVEHEIKITNRSERTILLPLQPTLAFSVRGTPGRLQQWWVERGGSYPTDVGTHRQAIGSGYRSSLTSHPSGSHGVPIPWWSVQDPKRREGWFAGIEFSGFVRMDLYANDKNCEEAGSLRASMGLGKSDEEDAAYRTRLGPGETFETPTVFVGCYVGDVDDGANRLRRWVQSSLQPRASANLPLLVSNSWGSGMAVDEALAHRMIDTAAELGLELYHVDAGWFRRPGDWRPDPRKFPAGMTALSRYARGKGLRFGIWLAWTQGGDDPDPTRPGAVLCVRDPAMTPWFPRNYPASWKTTSYPGATVCLGEAKAVDWCLHDARRAVDAYEVDLLEHDQDMVATACDRLDHRHTASPVDVAYHAALGYYRVQDGLRTAFPELLLENCCHGGRLVDYGVVRRSHYVSITDKYDPLSNRRAFYDASYALPPAMCECYVEEHSGKTLGNFVYMLRSGMMGWCSMMTDMSRWTPEQKAAAKREFDTYKQRLRPLIQHGDLYHVSERPDGRRWDGMQYYSPTDGRGVLFAFRGTTAEQRHTFPLKGLEPAARYRLTCQDASSPPAVVACRQLMETGLAVVLPEPTSSELVFLSREP